MPGSHKLRLDCCLLITVANVFPVFGSRDKCWTCFMLLKQLLEGTSSLSLVLFLTLVLPLALWGSGVEFITLFWNKVVNLILFNFIYGIYKLLVFLSHDGQCLLLTEAGNPRRSLYTGRFIMYSGITKIYYRKTVGHVFISLGMCQRPGIRPTIATWPRWRKGTDHYSSEEYRWSHFDACVARTWISYRCVPCHPQCTHRTSLVVKKKQFSCGCEQFH